MNKRIIALVAIGITTINIRNAVAVELPTCCFYKDATDASDLATGCSKIQCNDVIYEDCKTCANGSTPEQTTVTPCGLYGRSLTYGKCGFSVIDPDPIIPTPTCEAGSYATSDDLCANCPMPGTSAAGATSITDCFIPAGRTVSDETGSYIYTEDCYYKLKGNLTPVN